MTKISITVGPGAKLVRQGLQNLKKETPLVGRRQNYFTAQRIQKRMKVEGKKRNPGDPVHWDSLLQIAAFFASNGFGGGIPHVRTGTNLKWLVEKAGELGYRIFNKSKSIPFLNGDAFGLVHSEINKPQEWPIFRDVVDEEVAKLPGDVREELRIVQRRSGF